MIMLTDSTGKTSMMRVGFMTCLVIGSILALAGIVSAFMTLPDTSTMIVSGTGLMGSSGFAKAIQSKWEVN